MGWHPLPGRITRSCRITASSLVSFNRYSLGSCRSEHCSRYWWWSNEPKGWKLWAYLWQRTRGERHGGMPTTVKLTAPSASESKILGASSSQTAKFLFGWFWFALWVINCTRDKVLLRTKPGPGRLVYGKLSVSIFSRTSGAGKLWTRANQPLCVCGGGEDPAENMLSLLLWGTWLPGPEPTGRKVLRKKCAFPLNKKINLEKKCVLENIYLPAK